MLIKLTVYDDDDVTTLIRKAIPALSKQEASQLAHKISLAKDYCLESGSEDLVRIDNSPEFLNITQPTINGLGRLKCRFRRLNYASGPCHADEGKYPFLYAQPLQSHHGG